MDTHITIPMARLIELETAEHERDILRAKEARLAREAYAWREAARDATKAERERCAKRVLLHSQYPITTDFDRGYDKARKDAAETLRTMGDEAGLELGPNVGGEARLAAHQPCIGKDPYCPCQDGLACHYKDAPDGTKAMPIPPDDTDARVQRVMEAAVDYGVESLRVGSHESRCVFMNNGVADWQTAELRKKREAARAELERVVREALTK